MVIKKLNEKAPTGKVRNALFGDDRGLIKTFAVLTAENPMSQPYGDLENRQRNNRLRREIEHKRDTAQRESGLSKEDYFRKMHVQYIPIEGSFGNKEHSYIVLNIPYEDAVYLADKFGQMSFFFGEVYPDKTSEVSYYERDSVDKPYRFIEKSNRIDDASDFDDFFSKYGNLKWSFYLDYFNENYVPRYVTNRDAFYESFDVNGLTFRGRVMKRRQSHR